MPFAKAQSCQNCQFAQISQQASHLVDVESRQTRPDVCVNCRYQNTRCRPPEGPCPSRDFLRAKAQPKARTQCGERRA